MLRLISLKIVLANKLKELIQFGLPFKLFEVLVVKECKYKV